MQINCCNLIYLQCIRDAFKAPENSVLILNKKKK